MYYVNPNLVNLHRIVYQNNKTDEDTELIKKGWELAKKSIKTTYT